MKILLTSEFTKLNTGYAAYYREIAQALFNNGHSIVELACYGDANNPIHLEFVKSIPWTVYLNIPPKSNEQAWKSFTERENKRGDGKHGAWCFESICLKEKPDVVISIRDFWYDKFIIDSPLAKYMTIVLSPTVDSMPQQPEWIDGFSQVDILTTYNEWSDSWLKEQCNFKQLVDPISPGENKAFYIKDRKKCREQLGLPTNKKIVGTIMRNQFRKLYPKLLESVAEVPDLILYCHTGYPDKGWSLTNDIIRYRIQDRVYLSYKCKQCKQLVAKLFSDKKPFCKKCGGITETCNVHEGATIEELNNVYNTFDIYCQLHNSEGFGIPSLEAAQTGTRVLSTNYSAQEAVIPKIQGIGIKLSSLEKDFDTECMRAIPDKDHLVQLLSDPNTYIYNREEIRKVTLSNYSWEKTRQKWVNLIGGVVPKNKWGDQPDIQQPIPFDKIKHLPNDIFVMTCILRVAHMPSLCGSFQHATLLQRLNDKTVIPKDKNNVRENKVNKITKETIYKQLFYMRENINIWENKRLQSLQK